MTLGSRSLGEILDEHGGNGPGFSFLRIALSLVIVYLHSMAIAGGPPAAPLIVQSAGGITFNAPTGSLGSIAWAVLHQIRVLLVFGSQDTHFGEIPVLMFFALSGFLVTGSAFRTRSLTKFLSFRVLRIVPALFTEVSLSALFLGPILTTFPLVAYFSDPLFFAYFGNIVGHVQFTLPGLFDGNPLPAVVNGNLWTLPPEFYCYLITAATILSGTLFNRTLFSVLFALMTLAVLWLFPSGKDLLNPLYCFFCGVFFFHWRHNIPVNGYLFALACGAGYFLLKLPNTAMVAPIPVLYAIIWLGMQRFPQVKHLQKNDYSYGIYLYSFPIQQTIVYLGYRDWWIVFPLALTVSLVVAAFSWRFIEMPTLLLKRYLIKERPILPAAQFGSI